MGEGWSGQSQQKNITDSLMTTAITEKKKSDILPDSLFTENIMLM